MSKYKGIDEREIKCCDTNPNTIEAGISFEVAGDKNEINVLRFHFLEKIPGTEIIDQKTKTMYLNQSTADYLINKLQKMKFVKAKFCDCVKPYPGIDSKNIKYCKNCDRDFEIQ